MMVLAASKAYHSFFVKSSHNPRHQWNTINRILHHKSASTCTV